MIVSTALVKHFLFFHLQNNAPLTELDPALPSSPQPDDLLMNPPDDFLIDPLTEPAGSQSESKAASEVVSEPSDFEDLTNNLIDSPVDLGESAAADAPKAAMDVPLDEAAEEFVDILGSETEAPEEEVLENVAASDQSEVNCGAADQSGVGKHAVVEPEAPPTVVADPLIDILDEAPPAADAKKPKSQAPIDLFEDDGSDLFTEPRPSKTVTQPSTSLFGEPDEDLFGEPLGAAAKKPPAKEQQQSKPVAAVAPGGAAAAAAAVGGPLHDPVHKEPADIFSEEAVTAAPSSRNAAAVKSKTNGLHSEEESDIFAGRHATRLQGFHLRTPFDEWPSRAK